MLVVCGNKFKTVGKIIHDTGRHRCHDRPMTSPRIRLSLVGNSPDGTIGNPWSGGHRIISRLSQHARATKLRMILKLLTLALQLTAHRGAFGAVETLYRRTVAELLR
jgi:hypothetical protein